MVGHQHGILSLALSHDHRLPSILLIELQHCAIAIGICNHIMVARTLGNIVPDIQGGRQIQGLLHGGAAVEPETHDDGGTHLVLSALLAGSLIRQSHDGSAEPLLVDSVERRVDGCQAGQFLEARPGKLVQTISEVRHIAHGDGCIALLGTGDGHYRRVLVEVVVAAIVISVTLLLGSLEAGAGERSKGILYHLVALDAERKALSDTADNIFQQLSVAVDIAGDDIVEVILGAIFHSIEILISADLPDGTDGTDFTAPNAYDGNYCCNDKDAQPFKKLLHNNTLFTSRNRTHPLRGKQSA